MATRNEQTLINLFGSAISEHDYNITVIKQELIDHFEICFREINGDEDIFVARSSSGPIIEGRTYLVDITKSGVNVGFQSHSSVLVKLIEIESNDLTLFADGIDVLRAIAGI